MILKKSIDHLRENNMYYGEHVLFAVPQSIRMIVGGVMLMVHAFIPGLFPRIGSRVTSRLSEVFTIHENNRRRKT
jgi:hypothetical protein